MIKIRFKTKVVAIFILIFSIGFTLNDSHHDKDNESIISIETLLLANLSMDKNMSIANASFIGEAVSDGIDISVKGAGDVNNDTFDDFLIGASNNDEGPGDNAGQTYLIFGNETGWSMDMSLADANASFIGEADGDRSGCSVAGVRDVNGDGYDDILIGARLNDEGPGDNAGQTYLIFGKASGWSKDVSIADANASFIGETAGDQSGNSVAGAGDVNGDGYDDILIGAPYNDVGAGKTYLFFGKPSGWSMDINVSKANASFIGEAVNDYLGRSVAGAGDVNNDTFDDILIGAVRNGEGGGQAGQTYLIFGKTSGWSMNINVSNVNASFIGEEAGDWSGVAIAGAGNVNGDDYDDILIGASEGGNGKAYLIFGKATGEWSMNVDLSNVDASFIGEIIGDHAGRSVAGVGDVNGDKYDDILIGSYENDEGGDFAGQSYLIFGKALGWSMNVNLSNADASFIGEVAGDSLGRSAAGVGDVNGDNINDILIGAPSNAEGGGNAGQTYLIFGIDTYPPTLLINDPENDTIFYANAPSFNITCNDADLNCRWYSINDGFIWSDNYTFSGLIGTINQSLWSRIPDGSLIIRFYCNDTVGNMGFNEVTVKKSAFPPIPTLKMDINLSKADASFLGEETYDSSGRSVARAGDVNGDGYDDILIGASSNDEGGNSAGQVYLFFGKVEGFRMDLNVSNANASFIGEAEFDNAGFSIAGLGDVNGDGFDDIIIGARSNNEGPGSSAGQSYLILGKASGWLMDVYLSDANASFIGEAAVDRSGASVAGAGDVNGDGFNDILIGAPYNDEGPGDEAGQVYLILGKESGWLMDVYLSDANASFIGEAASDWAGYSVAGAGDVNGDGYDDILIGAPRNDGDSSRTGQTYLILGNATGWSMDMSLSNVNASFIGEAGDDELGGSVAGAGDVNGDDYDDILIGAYGNDEGGDGAGQAYLILGNATGWSMDVNVSNANASFIGEALNDQLGGGITGGLVAGAGDVNRDGLDDILLGARGNDDGGNDAGQTYLILGKKSGWSMDVNVSNVNASFIGEAGGDRSGDSLTGAGDVNGDGFDDILIGALYNGEGGDYAGQTYLVFGTDMIPPTIIIHDPDNGIVFSANAPSYDITCDDAYLIYHTWYSIYDGFTWSENYYFSELTGNINHTLWFSMPDGSLIIRFYGNDTAGNIGFNETTVIKNSIAPILTLNNLVNGTIFYSTAPSYDITCNDADLNSTWYSIHNGSAWLSNYTFSGLSGTINHILWDSLPFGSITIRFYANDTSGNFNYIDILIVKQAAVGGSNPWDLIIIIIIIGIVASISLASILVLRKLKTGSRKSSSPGIVNAGTKISLPDEDDIVVLMDDGEIEDAADITDMDFDL